MMLRFRKMMAVLLAAALTLTMLTACGGGGSGRNAVNEKVELTKSVNEALKKDGYTEVLKYDAELDKTAYLYRVYRENRTAERPQAFRCPEIYSNSTF